MNHQLESILIEIQKDQIIQSFIGRSSTRLNDLASLLRNNIRWKGHKTEEMLETIKMNMIKMNENGLPVINYYPGVFLDNEDVDREIMGKKECLKVIELAKKNVCHRGRLLYKWEIIGISSLKTIMDFGNEKISITFIFDYLANGSFSLRGYRCIYNDVIDIPNIDVLIQEAIFLFAKYEKSKYLAKSA